MTRSGVGHRRKGSEGDAIILKNWAIKRNRLGIRPRDGTSLSAVTHKWRLLYRP